MAFLEVRSYDRETDSEVYWLLTPHLMKDCCRVCYEDGEETPLRTNCAKHEGC